MFLNILKHNKARKFLSNYLSQQNEPAEERDHKIASAACIVHIDEFTTLPPLSGIAGDLNITPENFAVMAYTKTPEKYKNVSYPLFSFKDFNWRLKARESAAKTFLDGEYDILINYFTREKLPLLFLSASARAGIRVGFDRLNQNYNDIIFKIHPGNYELFREELLKYLKLLNKL